MTDMIKKAQDEFIEILRDVEHTEATHTRNAGTDYNCRQWFVEYGRAILAERDEEPTHEDYTTLQAERDALRAQLATARADALIEAAKLPYDERYGDDWLGMTCAILALIDAPLPAADPVALTGDLLTDAATHAKRNPLPVDADPVARAARDVLAERQRQIDVEGWTPEHDDAHDLGELARAAVCYAWPSQFNGRAMAEALGVWREPLPAILRGIWPWDREWWKPSTARRDLVKAGALILAEIERLDRAESRAIAGGEAKP